MDTNISSPGRPELQHPLPASGKKKKKCLPDLICIGLFVIGLFAIIAVMMQMILKGSFCHGERDVEKMAVETLRIKTGNPEGFKVTAVSSLDSVYVNRYCPEHEIVELSQKYLEYSLQMMRDSRDRSVAEDLSDMTSYRRFARGSDALELFNEMLQRPQGEFCGWRMRLRYSYLDDRKNECESEMWMIFDKDKRYIYNSFEFPVL
ncbi:MAG: hypothetical protein NC095_11675 [Muribaculum sp.]|nr:hypothetical protein [Muribaculum sp.]